MSFDAGGIAQMSSFNNNHGFSSSGLGAPGSGFGGGARGSRLNSKRLSVALPPKVNPISENAVDNPTPRTSRSHLLAGLRTQPKTQAVPASAPYNQTQHNVQGLGGSQWSDNRYNGYEQGIPQTASAAGFDVSQQYGMSAGRQNYSLPEQVLAPPSLYDQAEMDPNTLQQLQMTSLFLAQRQQQLQQKLAALSVQDQGYPQQQQQQMGFGRNQYQQGGMTSQTPQNVHGQLIQSPIEVQPGVYLVYNPAIQGYTYAFDQTAQQQAQQSQASSFSQAQYEPPTPSFSVSPPPASRSFTPPKKAPSPPSNEHVEPLPPPSATAFRRGHKKASSLAINPFATTMDGPKTASAASFGTQQRIIPPTPMTGAFAPGAARSGEHPVRQPRGPPAIEELVAAPTTKHEGSKNFATRQRRRALDSLMRAGTQRRGVSGSSRGSPVSESEFNYTIPEELDDGAFSSAASSRKMSPIGHEMKQKRGSQGSDSYFGLSSASSSEAEEMSAFKQPPTPATPVDGAPAGGDRKRMLGVLNAAEKRRSLIL